MPQKLVTLLTPCYNMEKYIFRLLDSVLSQTYPSIEMIVVDDGSTDKSAKVVQNYIPLFENKGYKLSYIYQPNSGQSVAIQNGLQLVKGEYLAWPDADDYYASDKTIAKMVERIESASAEFAMVRTQERILDENTSEQIAVRGLNAHEEEEASLFDDCLLVANDFFFTPGAYMVKFDKLKELTNLQIYTEKNAGQNWQLLLPVLYSYRCLTIKEVLYNVLERAASHSRGMYTGYDRTVLKLDSYEATLHGTINRITAMSEIDKEDYNFRVSCKYLHEKMDLAFTFGKRKDYILYYKKMSLLAKSKTSLREKIIYIASLTHTVSILKVLFKVYYFLRNRGNV